MRAALEGVPVVEPVPPPSIVTAAISPSSGRIVPEGTPGSIPEYFKVADFDRITSSGGYESDPALSNEEAFDIF
jgi:penicillin-binding protein 1A